MNPVTKGIGILTATLMMTLVSCRSSSSAETKDINGSPVINELSRSTQVAGHGMVIFGDNTIYLYHLPMWHGVHAWQIVLEASLDAVSLELYKNDRAKGSPLNTFSPTSFALGSLAPGFKIKGQIFHGHFEQGGTELQQDLVSTLTVKRIVMTTPLNPNGAARATPLYRVFGSGLEWYGAHVVSHNPDFDQIVALKAVPHALTAAQLTDGISVVLPGQSNAVSARPTAGAQLAGILPIGAALPFSVTGEIYFSVSDLGE